MPKLALGGEKTDIVGREKIEENTGASRGENMGR